MNSEAFIVSDAKMDEIRSAIRAMRKHMLDAAKKGDQESLKTFSILLANLTVIHLSLTNLPRASLN